MMQAPGVTGDRPTPYTLTRALLLYAAGRDDDHYATSHPVRQVDGRPVIGAGVPLGETALRQALAALGQPRGRGGWIDRNVLYLDDDCIVWQRPGTPRTMFHLRGSGLPEAVLAPHPLLVFAITTRAWYVVAGPAAGRDYRCRPADPLYHAPYANVYADGAICEGNVVLPARLALDTLQAFEDAFFDSRFGRPNHAATTRHPDGYAGMWRDELRNFLATAAVRPAATADVGTVATTAAPRPVTTSAAPAVSPRLPPPPIPPRPQPPPDADFRSHAHLVPQQRTLADFVAHITKGSR